MYEEYLEKVSKKELIKLCDSLLSEKLHNLTYTDRTIITMLKVLASEKE